MLHDLYTRSGLEVPDDNAATQVLSACVARSQCDSEIDDESPGNAVVSKRWDIRSENELRVLLLYIQECAVASFPWAPLLEFVVRNVKVDDADTMSVRARANTLSGRRFRDQRRRSRS